ncbi:MAG: NTPase [Thermodesulfovibrionales bacterium]
MKKNILITGLPGVGKTTLLKKLVVIFKEFNPAGFYTEEVLEDGNRVGFEIFNLHGDGQVFAHVKLKSKYAVGRYKVDLKGFEKFSEEVFSNEKKSSLYLIDEIGKMECLSRKFSKSIIEFMNSDKPFIATIADKGTGLIQDLKKRDDVKILEVTPANRDLRLKELTMIIRDLLLE